MTDHLRRTLAPLASLRLTVALIAMSIVLIFAATLAQVDKGIWRVVNEYFRSQFVRIELDIFVPRDWAVSGWIPWPGGYVLGAALLVNVLAAHAVRFKLRWRRVGVLMIHAALIFLLVGEAVTGTLALETQMPIYEGQTARWSHDIRTVELAVIDHGDARHDDVVVVSQAMLANADGPIRDERLPFDVHVVHFMVNARIATIRPGAEIDPEIRGLGRSLTVVELPEVSGVDEQSANYPAAFIALRRGDEDLGRYLLTPQFTPAIVGSLFQGGGAALGLIAPHDPEDQVTIIGQPVTVDGRTWHVYLRYQRHYKPSPDLPYAMHLVDFSHDLYTGTNTPRNFSSEVQLVDAAHGEDRVALISMNHPLRYRGETFYQSGWLGDNRGTVLQVVANPGWLIPYVACVLGGVGMIVHFGISLFTYVTRLSS